MKKKGATVQQAGNIKNIKRKSREITCNGLLRLLGLSLEWDGKEKQRLKRN